ncbi:alanine/glycine:cation symporter family protein [Aminicella lysinilytica]|uniref:alanine/glycine:cation symporter family protein n=1 Tax=Aminicella lysinilytica TaxID=433323 RepID=UPI0026E92112|nr:amino acid carrier protein [Aminicella lysinilytica]
MNGIFTAVDNLFAGIVPITDFLWDFPTNFSWYASIPVLGQFPLSILFLLGCGIYFTFKLGFVQIKEFNTGIKLLSPRLKTDVGTTPLQAFLISMAGRVGAGNIVGVTGAVTLGGPGAIFWMWISALFGMATGFCEATLAQIFKERKGNEYVGGFTFYIQKIWKNKVWVGSAMCVMYLIYNMLSIPVHTFHVFTAASSIMNVITGRTTSVTEPAYYVIAILIIACIAIITFGGIKRVASFSDGAVPLMAGLYILITLVLILINLDKVPGFFVAVFAGAFKPSSIFGGVFGVTLAQGLKRALLSNEAGMGTSTQASSTAEQNHPCEQGFVQSIGVFVDTIVICSLTGFIVTAGAIWKNPDIDWSTLSLDKIGTFLASVRELVPGTGIDGAVVIIAAIAFGLFAFTTLLCDLTYAEIAANKISKNKEFIRFIRILGAFVFVPLGTLTVLAGLQLDNLWYVSDMINVILVFINVPTLIVGRKYVMRAYKNYKESNGKRFVASDIGLESDVWTKEAAELKEKEMQEI